MLTHVGSQIVQHAEHLIARHLPALAIGYIRPEMHRVQHGDQHKSQQHDGGYRTGFAARHLMPGNAQMRLARGIDGKDYGHHEQQPEQRIGPQEIRLKAHARHHSSRTRGSTRV